MDLKKLEKFDDFNEDFVVSVLKSYVVDTHDLEEIEESTKLNLDINSSNEYKKLIKNLNLVYEVFKHSENVDGEVNLLGLIYKFENIFQADISTLIINILNRYYTNIHIYIPVSKRTFVTVKSDMIHVVKEIQKRTKKLMVNNAISGLQIAESNFILHDRIAGKVTVPIIIKKKKIGQLFFYYVDYKVKKRRNLL